MRVEALEDALPVDWALRGRLGLRGLLGLLGSLGSLGLRDGLGRLGILGLCDGVDSCGRLGLRGLAEARWRDWSCSCDEVVRWLCRLCVARELLSVV